MLLSGDVQSYHLQLPQDSCAGDTLGAGNQPLSRPLMIWIYTRGEREEKDLHKRRNPFPVASCWRSLWIYCGVKANASSSVSKIKYFLQASKLVLRRPQLYCKPWCGDWLAQRCSWRNVVLALQLASHRAFFSTAGLGTCLVLLGEWLSDYYLAFF